MHCMYPDSMKIQSHSHPAIRELQSTSIATTPPTHDGALSARRRALSCRKQMELACDLLRLQPRLRHHLRTQLAQQAIDLVDHRFRLRGLDIEFQHASG